MLADRPDGRRLNADEQRQLDDLERRLLSEPLAPPRPVPVGLAASKRLSPADRPVWLAALALVVGLLVLATVVGGPGGLAATATALLTTLIACRLPRLRFALPRPRPWLRRPG